MRPLAIKVIGGYFRIVLAGTNVIALDEYGDPYDRGGYFLREEATMRKKDLEKIR